VYIYTKCVLEDRRKDGCKDTGKDSSKDTQVLGSCPAHGPCTPELAPRHRVSRPRGTGSVGDGAGEGKKKHGKHKETHK